MLRFLMTQALLIKVQFILLCEIVRILPKAMDCIAKAHRPHELITFKLFLLTTRLSRLARFGA